jgi:type I restriction enzyme S subunit
VSKWEKVRLGDIGIFRTGGTPSRANPDFFQGNIPWITTVSLGKKIIDKNDAVEFISEEALKKSSAKLIKETSVMVGIRVGVGKSSINAVEMATNQDIVSIEDIDEKLIYKPYLLYFLNSCYQLFSSQQRGATIQGISSAVLKNLMVPIPPLNIQKQIAHELDTVSELLALRKHQLEELDQLIKSVFYEMFGDPVVNSKSWTTITGNQAFELSSGRFYPSKNLDDKYAYPCYGGNGVTGRSKEYLIDYPTIVIGRVGAYCGNIHLTTGKAWITDNAIYLKKYNDSMFDLEFIKHLFQEMNFNRFSDYSGQPKITQQPLLSLDYICPPIVLQKQFSDRIRRINGSKAVVEQTIKESQLLLDSLMSKYFDD